MQHNKVEDHVCISIGKKLNGLTTSSTERFIYKVHDHLRKVNEKAYEPEIIAIGPYHRGKKNLRMMEEHKLRYLTYRVGEGEKLQRYVFAMSDLEGEVRKCYAEPLKLKANELIEMMLLDGLFIVELFRKFEKPHLREKNDPIFKVDWIFNSLRRDLLLFENQLPFFVLSKLFNMIEDEDTHEMFDTIEYQDTHEMFDTIEDQACSFFSEKFPGLEYRGSPHKIKYLLELIHNNWLPSFEESSNIDDSEEERDWPSIPCVTELIEAGIKIVKIGGGNSVEERDWPSIPCVKELIEAGIKRVKIGGGNSVDINSNIEKTFFGIKFQKGVMQIPTLVVEDGTDSFFRNLIAYEVYHRCTGFHYIADYVKFMDCLIDSPKDVEILCRHGIIKNNLGDAGAVSNIFNKLNDNITWPIGFHYARLFDDVNKHCSKRRNKWMAKLRRNYLDSPWAIIAVLASFVLLVLTLLQTVFTIKK